MRASTIVGFAVAGGRSARMGRDKATLPWADGDLLGHALARLGTLTADVRILCGPEPRFADRGCPILTDTVAGAGAIAALLTALRVLPAHGVAVLLAVDLPLMTSAVLAHLVELQPGFDAVVPLAAEGPEPLAAVYAASARPAVEAAVAAGEFKMTAFWPRARVCAVKADTLPPFRPHGHLFMNVNTPEDYRRACEAEKT